MAVLTNIQKISALAVELLARSVVLPATVMRVPGAEYGGASGDTVTVRVRQNRTAEIQATPGDTINFDSINEIGVDVQVHHIYNAVPITDEDLSLNLVDFGSQVVQPSVLAVSRRAEQFIADLMNNMAADDSVDSPSGDQGKDYAAAIKDACQTLDEADVPAGDRYCAVSPYAARRLLDYEGIERAESYGSPSAVQDATIGRYAGFTIVKSNALTAGTLVAYHRSAFAMANRAPVPPRGVSQQQTQTYTESGYSLRVLFDYDVSKLTDVMAVSTFSGAAVVDPDRAYKVDLGS